MSLTQYSIDFSALSAQEKTAIVKRIEPWTYNCIHWNLDFLSGTFEIEPPVTLDALKIPSSVTVRKIV
jgi:hypothetical protein